MRFFLGESYERWFSAGWRLAVVVGLAEQGQRGTLRFADNDEECHLVFAELRGAGPWRRAAPASDDGR